MSAIVLQPLDIALAAALLLADAGLSVMLGLRLHRTVLMAAVRMVVQLVLVGLVLRWVFRIEDPWVTAAIVLAMTAVAAREVAARPRQRLARHGNLWVSAAAVGASTVIAVLLALTTALRPQPWWDPRYAIPVAGIVLGSALSCASLALDGVLGGAASARAGIEAHLMLGRSYRVAMRPLVADSIRRVLMPAVNQMAAAGIVTLPGTMTGQILAGADPVEAVKYQILLMLLLSGAGGLAAGIAAMLAARRLTDPRGRLRLDRMATP